MAEDILPEHCDIFARRLEEAIGRIRAWGVRVSDASRLPTAVRELRTVARNGKYSTYQRGLVRVANALAVATDFRHIASVLPPTFVRPLGEDLRRAVKGTLDDITSTGALRAQTQLQFGAVLAAAGLLPGAPDTARSRQSPDYIVSIDGLECGIEIGRPDGRKGAYAKIDDAIRQVRDFGLRHHVMILDHSDIIGNELRDASASGATIDVEEVFRSTNRELGRYIEGRLDPRIILLISQFQLFRWRSQPQLVPSPLYKFHLRVFRKAAGGLVQDQAERLGGRLMAGFRGLGAVIEGVRPLST